MQIIITKDYEEMSRVAMNHVLAHMFDGNPAKRKNLSITAGSTPLRMYEMLIPVVKDSPALENVYYYNFDEIPFWGEKHNVTMTDLNNAFFHPANIPSDRIEIFGTENYEGYDDKIQVDGGLDMLIMGLGTDGHFCGNLSGTVDHFGQGCRMIKKSQHPIPFFETEGISDYYTTFGPATVMQARHLIMIINGEHKAEIAKKVLLGDVDVSVPSSIFQIHPNFTVIIDQDAAKLL